MLGCNMAGVSDDMWSPCKQFHKVIQRILSNPHGSSVSELELCLKQYKQSFFSFLKNPPKNETHRTQLRSGMIEGISLSNNNRTMLISKDLADEAIILSDMFDLNELVALELLCTAQGHSAQYHGLPRGLIAVLLYYDGRKAMACALRDLFQATNGVSWEADMPKEISYLISSFTQSLVEECKILERLIELLADLDIGKETVMLTKNRALGPKKHQNQVIELFEDIRLALAMSLLNWSAQRGLPKAIVVKLIKNLSQYKRYDASGILDDVTLTVLMALIYGFDTSVLQRREDNCILVQNLPIIADKDFAKHVYEALIHTSTLESDNFRLDSVCKFAFSLSLANLRHNPPQNLQGEITKVVEYDEQLIDDALSAKVFDFLHYYILEKDIIFKNESFYRRLHYLLTDFIDFMHAKVTELRGRADETARTEINFTKEGLEPPANLDRNFEMLMLCIGKFYRNNRAGVSLCAEYWGPMDTTNINCSKASSRSVALYKFIRLAGELLPTSLFVSYLKMTAGLSSCERSARSAFNFFKQSSGLSGSTQLSWEHFFGSLTRYYSNLRQEQPTGSDAVLKHRSYSRHISPREIEGLRAVLGVITAVATYDEIARIAICEHPNWAPLHVLLGLVCCPITIFLKADILETLAALAKSNETAITLWNNLETSQIISTIETTSSFQTCSLAVEINENETRMESYPLTQGSLKMLHSLLTTFIPRYLGAGSRKPGVEPYLNFIIKGVFLQFYNRNYKNIAEKWAICAQCLEILYYLLITYEATPKDFYEVHEESVMPGYYILLSLQTKSDVLRLILFILDEAKTNLDEYNKFYGKSKLEECALLCLNIIYDALTKQNIFFDAQTSANSGVFLSGLSKILMDLNPRSKTPDHVLTITKFITYSSWLPRHSLVAIRILNIVSRQPTNAPQILEIFTQNEIIKNEIRRGFVECLNLEANSLINWKNDEKNLDLQIKEAIIDLLQENLSQQLPNLTHFLLGFDKQKDIYHNFYQKLGVIDPSCNCLNSIVFILDTHREMMNTIDTCDTEKEKFIDSVYCFLFNLIGNQKTSETILRYLRFCNDFLYRHLRAMPFKNTECCYVIRQMSNLLKSVAIELKVSASNNQISRFQHLSELLVATNGKSIFQSIPMELGHFYAKKVYPNNVFNKKPADKIGNLFLCHMLDYFNFNDQLTVPKWNYFETSLLNQILSECEVRVEPENKLINVKKMHEILNNELNTIQSAVASGQKKLIMQEIELILLFALRLNEQRNNKFAYTKLMEAWGQVAEVLISCLPECALEAVTKQELILEILEKIFTKVVPNQPIFELSLLSSGTILLLLVNLKACCFQNADSNKLEEHVLREDNSGNVLLSKSNTLSLKFVLKNILEWIISSRNFPQKLRINLYAALLNCLQILKGNLDTYEENNELYVSKLDSTMETKQSRSNIVLNRIQASVEVFLSFGDQIFEIICHDCIDGHDVCKMSALACADFLLNLDPMSSFINFFANRGYLSHIINSLLKCDEELCEVLYHTQENIRSLCMYESKMALLLRMSSSYLGAELLLSENVIGILSSMKVFSNHPELENHISYGRDLDSTTSYCVKERFRLILFPALNLCHCLLSTLKPDNHSVLSQVTRFILSHNNMIEIVLRTSTFTNVETLQDMAAITGLIARTTNQETFLLGDENVVQGFGLNLYQIQRLMFSVYINFIANEQVFKKMCKVSRENHEDNSLETLYYLQISANLALYFHNAISNHAADHRANNVLFAPAIIENIQRNEIHANSAPPAIKNLGLVVNQLKGAVDYYNSKKLNFENTKRNKTAIQNELYIKSNDKPQALLNDAGNVKELELCAFITEQCLYILWIHLDFYIRLMSQAQNTNCFPDSLQGLTVSSENIATLKKNLVSILNETFCKNLLISPESTEMDIGFNEVLLRRIKSLIQINSVN